MKPIGPMMREHRLIERMVRRFEKELEYINSENRADPVFIETAVDFFRTYADRTHHGKEEEIYFRDLGQKDVAPDLQQIMNELIEEHMYARAEVAALLAANDEYAGGNPEALGEVARHLALLVALYPGHIEKEDKHFFFPTQKYFTRGEQDSMLQEFQAFDAKMIHEKYEKVIQQVERE